MITIVKGSDKEVTLRLKNKSDNSPLDLTGKTVSVKYKNADSSITTLNAEIVGVATQGRIKFVFDNAQTEALKAGFKENPEPLPIDVYVVEGADEEIYKGDGILQVRDRIR